MLTLPHAIIDPKSYLLGISGILAHNAKKGIAMPPKAVASLARSLGEVAALLPSLTPPST